MTKHSFTRRLSTWFLALSQREKMMVAIAVLVIVIYTMSLPASYLMEYLTDNERMIQQRKVQLRQLESSLERYRQLEERLNKLQTNFARSQMTYEQVTQEIDQIVKKSIGKDDYELKRSHDPTPFGLDFSRQDFTLRLKSVSLEQLVSLLFNIEQGHNPLFVGKVDIAATGGHSHTFSVALDISSISKGRS